MGIFWLNLNTFFIKFQLMPQRKKELDFFSLFDRFISDSQRGRRLQPNGKKIGPDTIQNYVYTRKLLHEFCEFSGISLRIRPMRLLNHRDLQAEKNYWKKFYRRFTDFLYNNCGHFDNYVGQNIKILKAFFNYVNKELHPGAGDFHKLFYVRNEEIAIHPVLPEELNFLIYDKSFEDSLSPRMQEVKDFFVFGCTVALRLSDLLRLKRANLRENAGQYYLAVRSQKTATDSLVRLPDYAVDIVKKYRKSKTRLLPSFNKVNLNKYIKELLELAGFTQPVGKTREKRGKRLELARNGSRGKTYRFCDVASTHTMRRTAITTMLSLGMPEQLVRKISGHAPGSKEFYRYVLWAQTYQDQETEKVFERLKEKRRLAV